ncbi:6958_t:CDS:2 [Funneliformis geosporum]|uniref:6958_t:CDS:1 n=1 Tax=Funneliformis geosporum TaxID=1117311 RepID=A0A9W4SU16_9GLOM|nr:6958_t:CDS:2 [Funneliformis geosporum]
MKAQETLLNELTLDIAVPNGIIQCTKEDVDSIFTTKARTIAYYDETLYFYLIIVLPSDSDLSDHDAATNYFHQLEIFVEASIIDASTLSVPSPNPPAVYRLPPPGKSRESSSATSPSIPGTPLPPLMDKRISKPTEGAVIYSYLYNPNTKDRQMVVLERNGCWNCVFPLAVPVAYVKTRAQTPALALNAIVTHKPQPKVQIDILKSPEADLYSPENFGNMNLLEGLNDDSTKSLLLPPSRLYSSDAKRANSSYSSPTMRRDIRKILSVKSALNVRMRTTSVSPLDNALMMSVELENNTDAGGSFSVEVVKVEIAYGFVTRYDWGPKDNKADKFPLTLNPVDQVTFLYNITILDDPSFPKLVPTPYPTPNPHSRNQSRRSSVASVYSVNSSYAPPSEDRQRHVSIVVKGSPVHDDVKSRSIESRWNCMLDLSNLRRREDSYQPPIPQNTNQKSLSLLTRPGQSHSPSSSRSATLFSPTGSLTPTASRNYFSTDNNARGKKPYAGLPTIPDHDNIGIGNGILSSGRTPLSEKSMEVEVGDGVVVSFLVASKVVVGKIFTIHVFVVNRSKHIRRFTVMVPNKKRPNEKAIRNLVAAPLGAKITIQTEQMVDVNGNQSNQLEPFLDESDFIKKYLETETPDADIVCLENNVRIGPLHPSTCESVALHFIAIKESLHMIELVQLVDNDTGFITNLRNVLEIHVAKSLDPNSKKVNKRSSGVNNTNYSTTYPSREIEVN